MYQHPCFLNSKVADLEKAVSLRNQFVAAASRSAAPPHQAAATEEKDTRTPPFPWNLEEDTDGPDPVLWALASGHETAGLAERLESAFSWTSRGGERRGEAAGSAVGDAVTHGAPSSAGAGGRAKWCPRRVRLRTRLGKRCRKDLAAGRTGILIKATFDPLEGDSSTAKASKPFVCLFGLAVFIVQFVSFFMHACTKIENWVNVFSV